MDRGNQGRCKACKIRWVWEGGINWALVDCPICRGELQRTNSRSKLEVREAVVSDGIYEERKRLYLPGTIKIKWDGGYRSRLDPQEAIDYPARCDDCDLCSDDPRCSDCLIDCMMEVEKPAKKYLPHSGRTFLIPGPDCFGPGEYELKRKNRTKEVL